MGESNFKKFDIELGLLGLTADMYSEFDVLMLRYLQYMQDRRIKNQKMNMTCRNNTIPKGIIIFMCYIKYRKYTTNSCDVVSNIARYFFEQS